MQSENFQLVVTAYYAVTEHKRVVAAVKRLRQLNCCGTVSMKKVLNIRKWNITVQKNPDIAAGYLSVFHDLDVVIRN